MNTKSESSLAQRCSIMVTSATVCGGFVSWFVKANEVDGGIGNETWRSSSKAAGG